MNQDPNDDDAAERLRQQAMLCLRLADKATDKRLARELRKLADDCLRAATEQPVIH